MITAESIDSRVYILRRNSELQSSGYEKDSYHGRIVNFILLLIMRDIQESSKKNIGK